MNISIIPSDLSNLEPSLTAIGLDAIVRILPSIQAEVKNATSWRVYRQDIKSFASWLYNEQIDIHHITRVDLLNYRKYLDELGNANITINRMFTVARLVVAELVHAGDIEHSPLGKKFKPLPTSDETTHVALDKSQAKQLLEAINVGTVKGKRDYAIVSLLMRCGLRRDECRMLNIGNIKMKQGHHVIDIEDGKGGKPATVKLPPDVWRYINEYMQALQDKHPRRDARLESPLFISFRKGDHPSLRKDKTGKFVEQRIDVKAIETLVIELGDAIGATGLSPHGLRATFITLALEAHATILEVQYAARHKDPRTTERYQKRKLNLDNNAVDKLSFLARDED